MKNKPRSKRTKAGRRRSPGWYLLRQFWTEGVECSLAKFDRKLDKILNLYKTKCPERIGFQYPDDL